jgi:C_GCAxxG_C_C family probable redox protein
MKHSENAKEHFLSDCNCAQSVLLSYADDLKYSKELAQKMGAGFGGGMGKRQETCGAVTGAIMVLGMMKGEQVNNNEDLKSYTYESVQELINRFTAEHGSTQCKDLIGCDLNTPEGAAQFKQENMKENVCAKFVETAVDIIDSMAR